MKNISLEHVCPLLLNKNKLLFSCAIGHDLKNYDCTAILLIKIALISQNHCTWNLKALIIFEVLNFIVGGALWGMPNITRNKVQVYLLMSEQKKTHH